MNRSSVRFRQAAQRAPRLYRPAPRRPTVAAMLPTRFLAALAGIGALGVTAATVPAAAGSGALAFKTVKLAGSSGVSEPRVTVTPKGIRFAVTNAGRANEIGIGPETVYRS